MIEVRIRHEWDEDAIHLMEVPWDQIDAVLPLLKRWGLRGENFIDHERLTGQFKFDGLAAFFEIEIEDRE